MATLAQIMEDDLQAQRDELPVSFTFDSASYTGSRNDLRESKEQEDAGYLAQSEIELVIVLSEFASPPVENDTRLITMGGVIYRVASVMTGADTVSATLGLRKSN